MFNFVSSILGDVDGDGTATMLDAIQIASYTVGSVEFTEEQLSCGDYDKDGNVTMLDAVKIAQSTVE